MTDDEETLSEMQELFFDKFKNAVDLYSPYLPGDFPVDLYKVDFATLFAAIGTYLLPLKRHFENRDKDFLLGLIETAYTKFAVRDVYENQLDDEKRDKLWRYFHFFINWYEEYTTNE